MPRGSSILKPGISQKYYGKWYARRKNIANAIGTKEIFQLPTELAWEDFVYTVHRMYLCTYWIHAQSNVVVEEETRTPRNNRMCKVMMKNADQYAQYVSSHLPCLCPSIECSSYDRPVMINWTFSMALPVLRVPLLKLDRGYIDAHPISLLNLYVFAFGLTSVIVLRFAGHPCALFVGRLEHNALTAFEAVEPAAGPPVWVESINGLGQQRIERTGRRVSPPAVTSHPCTMVDVQATSFSCFIF